MTWLNSFKVSAAMLAFGATASPASAGLLFSDNWDTPTALPSGNPGAYDSIDQNPYQGGSLAGTVAVRAGNFAYGTTGLSGSPAGVATGVRAIRFQEEVPGYGNAWGDGSQTTAKYNWATVLAVESSAGNNVLRVSYDANFIESTYSYGFAFGTASDTNGFTGGGVSPAGALGTDIGVSFNGNGITSYYDNSISNSTFFDPFTGWQTIVIEVGYAGVNAGDALTLNAWVGETQVLTDITGFTWDFTLADGTTPDPTPGIYFTLETQSTGGRQIDNLAISTVAVPEPSVISLAFVGLAGLMFIRGHRLRLRKGCS
jgi:hypothetical protein